jgi:hypothetical protein
VDQLSRTERSVLSYRAGVRPCRSITSANAFGGCGLGYRWRVAQASNGCPIHGVLVSCDEWALALRANRILFTDEKLGRRHNAISSSTKACSDGPSLISTCLPCFIPTKIKTSKTSAKTLVKPQNHSSPSIQTTSPWPLSSLQSCILNLVEKIEKPRRSSPTPGAYLFGMKTLAPSPQAKSNRIKTLPQSPNPKSKPKPNRMKTLRTFRRGEGSTLQPQFTLSRSRSEPMPPHDLGERFWVGRGWFTDEAAALGPPCTYAPPPAPFGAFSPEAISVMCLLRVQLDWSFLRAVGASAAGHRTAKTRETA